jgi:predicted DNA-binding transcriptional regulator YafY
MKSLLQRLVRLDYLISHKKTGNPEALASKVGISERSIYDYLRIMKSMGAPISYSREHLSYYYKEDGKFRIGFIETEGLQ